jgi:ADP-heptose:LPS heptosyltransferase
MLKSIWSLDPNMIVVFPEPDTRYGEIIDNLTDNLNVLLPNQFYILRENLKPYWSTVIQNASFVISHDSGTVHLANALLNPAQILTFTIYKDAPVLSKSAAHWNFPGNKVALINEEKVVLELEPAIINFLDPNGDIILSNSNKALEALCNLSLQ